MHACRMITVVGCHAEGEIGDVIVGGVLPPPGATMLDKMMAMARDHDHIRRLLICEPRGSVARHVNLLVPACRADCDAGAIIMEPTEYPPMSGSNAICIATVLLETGILPMTEPVTRFRLDMPGGPVDVEANCRAGKCVSVRLENVPCCTLALDAAVELSDGKQIVVDMAYGGMIFALVDASQLGIDIVPENARRLSELGEEVRQAVRAQHPDIAHPELANVRGVSIVQFNTPVAAPGGRARNACIVSPGRVDRSPTGTGLSARLAVLHARGRLGVGDTLTHESIIGSSFLGRIEREATIAGRPAIVPSIEGRAWLTGTSQYFIDPSDPYPQGYIVADTWGCTMRLDQ
jgi:trans-L-3-hydroxyproline dehydratase